MTDLIYRQGSAKDLEQLQALRIASYSELAEKMPAAERESFVKSLSDESWLLPIIQVSTVFVCEHNSRIAGMAYLVPRGNPTHIYPAEWCYIRMVGVDPAYRGKGIARALTIACIDHATAAGEATIALHTSEVMDAARHIYEGLGFKVYKEINRIYGFRYWLYTLDIGGGEQ